MLDPYKRDKPGLNDPASNLIEITPDDDTDIAIGIKALRIFNPNETAATVVVVTADDNEVTIKVPATCLWTEPLRVSRVKATGTTAGLEFHGYTDYPLGD